MTNAVLTFGKFKGSKFCDTPKWYQNWAVKQPGFMKRLTGKKYVDAFQQEKSSVDPEKKFYDGYATYLERDSDNGSDY